MGTIFVALALVGLVLVATGWAAQMHLLRRGRREASRRSAAPDASPTSLGRSAWPAVTVLKPLKGADAGLADGLRSVLSVDHPASSLQVVFGVETEDDPGLAVAREVAAEFPHVDVAFVVDPRKIGLNPKVANLANMMRAARHDILVISDSNVRVERGWLRGLVEALRRPDVGLVSSPIRGAEGEALGGALECLQLNGFVMRGVSLVGGVFERPCVVGKSMALRREDLEAIGGLGFLVEHLAEDQVSGEEIHRLGRRVVVTGEPVTNVVGRPGVRGFVSRHLRWARIRWRLHPVAYLAELLLEPFPLALAAATLAPGPWTLAFAAATLLSMSAMVAIAERSMGVRRSLIAYPPLEALRSVLVLACLPVPLVRCTVTWRGNEVAVGPRTRLQAAPRLAEDPFPSVASIGDPS